MTTSVLQRVKNQRSILIVVGLLVLIALIGIITESKFRTGHNFLNIFGQSISLGLISLGQTVVVLTGGIDLSIGGVINLCSSLLSGTVNGNGHLIVPAVIGVLALGAAIGTLSGFIITRLRVHPIIVTLGVGTMAQGATLIYTLEPAGKMPTYFSKLAWGTFHGIPYSGIMMLVLFLLVGLFLHRVRLGRYIYAVGGSAEGARLSGISARRVILFAYATSGFFAALCAVYLVSRMGVGDPWMAKGYELISITPVVIGGTLLSGGRGGVFGTLIGVLLMSMLNNVLNFMGITSYYQWIVQGVIIIIAVSLYSERTRRHD
jgi:ribose transport system permease protein